MKGTYPSLGGGTSAGVACKEEDKLALLLEERELFWLCRLDGRFAFLRWRRGKDQARYFTKSLPKEDILVHER